MQPPENKQQTTSEYALTPPEQAALRSLNTTIVLVKGQIFDLNAALETAQGELRAAEAQYRGALNLLATAHGFDKARLSDDLTKLTRE